MKNTIFILFLVILFLFLGCESQTKIEIPNCDNLTDIIEKDLCYIKLGPAKKDLSICDNVSIREIKEGCIRNTKNAMRDPKKEFGQLGGEMDRAFFHQITSERSFYVSKENITIIRGEKIWGQLSLPWMAFLNIEDYEKEFIYGDITVDCDSNNQIKFKLSSRSGGTIGPKRIVQPLGGIYIELEEDALKDICIFKIPVIIDQDKTETLEVKVIII